MKAIYGLYSDPDSAQHAVESLRRAGVADDSISVLASQPYEEYEFSHRYKQTWLFWIAAGGGALGLWLCLGFTPNPPHPPPDPKKPTLKPKPVPHSDAA